MPGGLSAAEEAALDAMLEGRDSDDEEDDIMALLGEDEQGTDDDEGDDDDDADDDDDDDGDGDADGDAGDDDDGNGAGAVAAPAAPAASASALAADAGESDDGSSSKEDDDSSSASLDALGVVDGVAAKGSAPEKVEPAANAKGEGVALSTPAKAEEPEVGAVHEETSTADKGADPAPDVRQEAAVAEDAAAATGALEAADKGAAVAEDAVVATGALEAADAATADDADASKNDVEDAAGDEGDDAAGDVTEPAAKKRREKEDSSDDGGDMEADEGGDTASGCPQRPPSAFRLFSQALRLELAGTGLTVPEMAKKINERWAELDPAKQAEYHASSQQARDEYVVALAKYHRSSEYHKYVDKQAALEKKQASRRLKAEFAGKLPKRPQRARDLFRAEKKITGKFEDLAKAWDALPEGEQSRYKAEAAKLKADYDRAVAAYRDTEGRRIQKEERAAIRRADIKAARLKFLVDAPKRPPAAKALFAVERRKSDPSKGDALAPAVAQKMSAEKLSAEWEALPADEQTKFEEQAARLRTEYDKEWEEFKKTDDYKALRKVEEGASASERKSKGTDKSKGKGKGKGRGKNEATVAPESMPTMPPSAYDTWAKDRKARGAKSSRKDWGALPADEKAALEKKREEDVAAYRQALAAWEKSKEGKRYLRKKDAATAKATTKRKLETAFNEFFNGNPPKRPPAPMMLFAASSERAPGKVAEAWSNLSSDAKQKWEAKRTELVKAYEQRIEDFKKSTSYKKATKAGPAKEAKSSKKDAAAAPTKAKLETKSETAVKDFFKGDLPKKPPSGMMLFAASGEKKPGTMVAAAWAALSSDEKAKWEAKRIELLKEYQEKMDKCKSSAAYKKAAKADEQAKTKQSRKDKDKKAREKFLQGSNAPVAPKQPASAFRLFLDAERPNLPAGLSGPEQASKLGEKWKAMDTAARAQFCEKAEQLKAAYEQEMQTYKSHPAYKKYEQAVRKLKGVAGKDAKGNKEKEERDEAYQLIYGGPKRVSAGGSSTAGTGSRGGRGRGGGSRGRGRGKPGAVDAKLGSSDSDDSGSSSSSSSESLNI